jgi:hypothetical protein
MSLPAKKTKRAMFNTTIDRELLAKAQMLRILLKQHGINKDGVNELIEEGLRKVINEYSNEMGINL